MQNLSKFPGNPPQNTKLSQKMSKILGFFDSIVMSAKLHKRYPQPVDNMCAGEVVVYPCHI